MARKPNHAWEKRQREIAKQAKRTAKLLKKQEGKPQTDDAPQEGSASASAAPADSQQPQ